MMCMYNKSGKDSEFMTAKVFIWYITGSNGWEIMSIRSVYQYNVQWNMEMSPRTKRDMFALAAGTRGLLLSRGGMTEISTGYRPLLTSFATPPASLGS